MLTIGPSPELAGGMSAVVGQMLSLPCGGRYRVQLFTITTSQDEAETMTDRVARHVRQMQALSRRITLAAARVVHIHTCSGFSFYRSAADLVLARRQECRTVLHVHGAAFDEFFASASHIQRSMIRWTLTAADAVIALSAGWARQLRAMAPDARVRVVENAVAIPPPVPARAHGGPCRFLLLAKMDEWKGIDDLLAACTILRSQGSALEMTLAGPPGTAGDADGLRAKISARGLAGMVRYVGVVRGEAKNHLLRWADAYVQPSHHEGMPLALLEGLAYGLPAVATCVGAVPEVVSPGREGLIVDPRDPSALAAAMASLAGDPGLRARCGDAARETAVARFSLEHLERNLVDLYDDLCSTATPGPQAKGRESRSPIAPAGV
ncbi:MAG: glycosyltransferase family 4 protein [Gemmataceae bacterium]|nr:glycosyltransferase family 4 protein [Gemmataceae bacterium]